MITPTTVIWMHKHTICLSKINLSSKSSPKPPTGLDAWFINSLCLFLQKTKLPGQSRRGSGVKQCLQLVWLESSVSQLIENLKIRINTISQLIMAPYFLWDNRKPFYNVSRKSEVHIADIHFCCFLKVIKQFHDWVLHFEGDEKKLLTFKSL